jgi:hypothetical protein
MLCKFIPGQRVVCVDTKGCPLCGKETNLILKSIYTIIGVYLIGDNIMVAVEELQACSTAEIFFGPGFLHTCFEPVRETSIEVFKQALVPKPDDKPDVGEPEKRKTKELEPA